MWWISLSTVLDNLTSDEEIAVLRDQGVIQQGHSKHKPNKSFHQIEKYGNVITDSN